MFYHPIILFVGTENGETLCRSFPGKQSDAEGVGSSRHSSSLGETHTDNLGSREQVWIVQEFSQHKSLTVESCGL